MSRRRDFVNKPLAIPSHANSFGQGRQRPHTSLDLLADIVRKKKWNPSFVIVGKRCQRNACKRCNSITCSAMKKVALERLDDLRRESGTSGWLVMATFTVRQSSRTSPEATHKELRADKRIARSMEALGVEYWVCSAEMCGSGYFHYHAIGWSASPILQTREKLCVQAWGMGNVSFVRAQRPERQNQLLGYIFKGAWNGVESVPDWVLDQTRILLYSSSVPWGPITPSTEHLQKAKASSGLSGRCSSKALHPTSRVQARTTRETVNACLQSATLLMIQDPKWAPSMPRRFVADIPVPLKLIKRVYARCGGTGRLALQIHFGTDRLLLERVLKVLGISLSDYSWPRHPNIEILNAPEMSLSINDITYLLNSM